MIINKKRLSEIFLSFIAVAVLVSFTTLVCHADDDDIIKDAIYSVNFESADDMKQWAPFGDPVNLERDSSNSHTGNYSLRASERSERFSGPSLNITDMVNSTDEFFILSVFVMYDKNNGNDTLKASLKYTYTDGTEDYETIYTIESEDMDNLRWFHIKTAFAVPENSAETVLYFETQNTLSTIWIDDFQLAKDTEQEISETVYFVKPTGTTEYTFESTIYPGISKYFPVKTMKSDNIEDGFTEKPELNRSKDIASGGDYSLKISGRTDSRQGISLDISSLTPEKQYMFSAYVIYTDKAHDHEHFSVYLEYYRSGIMYSNEIIPDQKLDRKSWACLSQIFTVPSGAENAQLVINTLKPEDEYNYEHVSFYVDNIRISDDPDVMTDKIDIQRKNLLRIIVIAAASAAVFVIVFMLRVHYTIKTKKEEATHDSMTGSYNRNAFEERIELLEKKPELCRDLFFAACDVNGLKLLNDNFGHQVGDACIVKCAEILNDVMSQCGGKAYRTGGDEFICISEKSFSRELGEAVYIAEKQSGSYPFSISVGYASYNPYEDGDPPDIKSIIDRCDKEMYINKKKKKEQKNK